jgi:hypothetical protein
VSALFDWCHRLRIVPLPLPHIEGSVRRHETRALDTLACSQFRYSSARRRPRSRRSVSRPVDRARLRSRLGRCFPLCCQQEVAALPRLRPTSRLALRLSRSRRLAVARRTPSGGSRRLSRSNRSDRCRVVDSPVGASPRSPISHRGHARRMSISTSPGSGRHHSTSLAVRPYRVDWRSRYLVVPLLVVARSGWV